MQANPSEGDPITEEEFEAWLATRPYADDASSSYVGTGTQQNAWPASDTPQNETDCSDHGYFDDHRAASRRQSTASSFAAQFLSGTRENEILMHALAEQHQPYHENASFTSLPQHNYDAAIADPSQSEWHEAQQQLLLATPSIGAFQPLHKSLQSPQSDFLSSPEEVRRHRHSFRTPPSRVSQASLHSLPEQEPFDVLMPVISPQLSFDDKAPSQQQQHLFTSAAGSPNDLRLTRRSSAEIEAIRMRRHNRLTYAGPSSRVTSVYSPTTGVLASGSPAFATPPTSFTSSYGRPTSANSSEAPAFSFRTRQRAGTNLSTTSTTSSNTDLRLDFLHQARQYQHTAASIDFEVRAESLGGGIPTSLSAELAGLGLNAHNFLQNRSGNLEEEWSKDVNMQDEHLSQYDDSMQRSTSSSSASTTKRRTLDGLADNSLFSNVTTSSSGLEDSVFLSADSNASRWVHGRDTPPNTSHRANKQQPQRQEQATSTLLSSELDIANMRLQYAQTWPRSLSNTSSGELVSTQHTRSSMTPLSTFVDSVGTSNMANVDPDTAERFLSPVQHSYSDSVTLRPTTTNYNPSISHSGAPSSQHTRPTTARRMHSSGDHVGRRPSARTSLARLTNAINDPHQQNPLHQAGASSAFARRNERKRWSMSIMGGGGGGGDSSDSVYVGSHTSKPTDQYEEVSVALDRLRTFLRQRERKEQPSSAQSPHFAQQPTFVEEVQASSSRRGSDAHDATLPQSSAALSPNVSQTAYATRGFADRAEGHHPRLRHSAKPLPPRGTLSRSASGLPIASSDANRRQQYVSSPPAVQHKHFDHSRTPSLSPSSSFFDSLPRRPRQRSSHSSFLPPSYSGTHASTTNVDRIATLENLADRLQRMRQADRQ